MQFKFINRTLSQAFHVYAVIWKAVLAVLTYLIVAYMFKQSSKAMENVILRRLASFIVIAGILIQQYIYCFIIIFFGICNSLWVQFNSSLFQIFYLIMINGCVFTEKVGNA